MAHPPEPLQRIVAPGDWPVFGVSWHPQGHQLAVATRGSRVRVYDLLFASTLQPSDSPTADVVTQAIKWTLRQFGVRGTVRPTRRAAPGMVPNPP